MGLHRLWQRHTIFPSFPHRLASICWLCFCFPQPAAATDQQLLAAALRKRLGGVLIDPRGDKRAKCDSRRPWEQLLDVACLAGFEAAEQTWQAATAAALEQAVHDRTPALGLVFHRAVQAAKKAIAPQRGQLPGAPPRKHKKKKKKKRAVSHSRATAGRRTVDPGGDKGVVALLTCSHVALCLSCSAHSKPGTCFTVHSSGVASKGRCSRSQRWT